MSRRLRPFECIFVTAVAFASVISTSARSLESVDEFQRWVSLHDRIYDNQSELVYRQQVFQANKQKIDANNERQHSFKLALNHFADLTEEEFKGLYLGFKPDLEGIHRNVNTTFSHGNVQAPLSVDWVEKGAVTGVKNQLFCGSCWAYSTTGSIEGANYLYTGKLVSLSEQQLVDCDTSKDMGCSGGLMDYAFKYVIKNGGIDTESDYSYYSVDEYCNTLREDRHVVSIDTYEDVPKNNEADLAKAVSQQPVSVAICASQLQFYSSGVVDDCCTELDHGVLAVGYGEDETGKFWLVKNSWGETWGENGFFRLRKDVEKPAGTCNIAEAASYPIKKTPNPRDVPEVCGFWGQTECKAGTTCQCNYDILGAACLQWTCTPTKPPQTWFA